MSHTTYLVNYFSVIINVEQGVTDKAYKYNQEMVNFEFVVRLNSFVSIPQPKRAKSVLQQCEFFLLCEIFGVFKAFPQIDHYWLKSRVVYNIHAVNAFQQYYVVKKEKKCEFLNPLKRKNKHVYYFLGLVWDKLITRMNFLKLYFIIILKNKNIIF